jgi:hypothetical protein
MLKRFISAGCIAATANTRDSLVIEIVIASEHDSSTE